MYAIVIGAGSIGSQVIDMLTHSHHDVVVVEKNSDRAQRASHEYDCLVINDDATVKETLAEAGAGDADAIIATTDEDATNIMTMLLGKEFDVPSLVSVVQNDEHMHVFRRIGVNVLENPQRLIGEYLVRAVQRPSVKDFMDLAGDAEIFEITATKDGRVTGKTLAAADRGGVLPDDVRIVAVERDQSTILPEGDTEIRAGDLVTVFSRNGVSSECSRVFVGE